MEFWKYNGLWNDIKCESLLEKRKRKNEERKNAPYKSATVILKKKITYTKKEERGKDEKMENLL